MGAAQQSKQNVAASSKITTKTTTVSFNANKLGHRNIQNYLLIWVDANINQSTMDCKNTMTQLRSVVNDINLFTEPDKCIRFLKNIDNEKAFVIVSGSLGRQLIPDIHGLPQLDAIYIFCSNTSLHEQWAGKWNKIKGVYSEITLICKKLEIAAKQCNEDSIVPGFIGANVGTSGQTLDPIEPSFVYTQIFKEILLEMEHDETSLETLATYCRKLYPDNETQLKYINEFEKDYHSDSAIWWYTRECFLYQMLNRALRMLEGDTIINMGFFMHDLHRQIEKLYRKQVKSYNGKSFIVYRGQGLSSENFDKLCKTKDGLMYFNNFLSTSMISEAARRFAKRALSKTDTIAILFKMSINPSVSSAPFANVREVSDHNEEEILFSMHTVFRIGDIRKIDEYTEFYQVELTLIADNDQQLRTLTERIRRETPGDNGWERLGHLLVITGQFDKAEEVYQLLLEKTSDQNERACFYHQLGYVKNNQGDYDNAIRYYKKALEIKQKTLSQNSHSFITSYNNIGEVYRNMGEYPKAFSFYEKALEICQKTLPPDHLDLAVSYNNIGGVYQNVEEYSKALVYYEKAFKIRVKTLPENHPSLATSYNNIGMMYYKMNEYEKALSFYEKDLQICEKILPPNHPDLATSYNNIGGVYQSMKRYQEALSSYDKTRRIFEKTLSSNHPSLATSYNNIGMVYYNMEKYSKALAYFERALDIRRHSLPPNHPSIKSVLESIESVKAKL